MQKAYTHSYVNNDEHFGWGVTDGFKRVCFLFLSVFPKTFHNRHIMILFPKKTSCVL